MENSDMGGISYIEELKKLRDEVAHFCDRLCQRIRLRRAILRASLIAAALLCLSAPAARANVLISVDKASQQMSVSVDGVPRYRWTVSTGRAGYGTPSGTYQPQRMERTWFSKEYYNSPMPHSIFFHGGYAIHGSYEINRLGGPASHGCIRLHPAHAATLFALVKQKGIGNTIIVVSGGHRSW
jgi:L,D-transpeptidase catalytic domain